MRTRNQVMADLKRMFPNEFIRKGEEFGGSYDESTIWTGFAEAHDENCEDYFGHIVDYYAQSEHPKIEAYLKRHPHVWYEFLDAGTAFFIVDVEESA